jgi:hypothetical protein
VCLTAGSLIDRRPAVNRLHGSAGGSRAGTVRPFAGSWIVLPACGESPGWVCGRYQAGTVCLIAGTRRLAGPGAVPRPASAGHYQAGTVRPIAGRAPTRWAGGGLPAGLRRALSGGHSVPDRWRSSDSAGAASPAATLWSQDRVSCQGRAGRQSKEGRLDSLRAASPGSGRRATRPFRQARGADSKGTGEPSILFQLYLKISKFI